MTEDDVALLSVDVFMKDGTTFTFEKANTTKEKLTKYLNDNKFIFMGDVVLNANEVKYVMIKE